MTKNLAPSSFFLLTVVFMLTGCAGFQKKENKLQYTIKTGETFQVMLDNNPSTGSFICFLNEKSMKVASLVKSEYIRYGADDCDGCGGTNVYTFKGIAKGTDSIKMKTFYAQADSSCIPGGSADPDKLFIVTVE